MSVLAAAVSTQTVPSAAAVSFLRFLFLKPKICRHEIYLTNRWSNKGKTLNLEVILSLWDSPMCREDIICVPSEDFQIPTKFPGVGCPTRMTDLSAFATHFTKERGPRDI